MRLWTVICIVQLLLLQAANTGTAEVPGGNTPVRFHSDLSIRFQHFEPVVNIPGLIGYWPMNEGSGYTCLDGSGHQLTGYITGSEWNTRNSGLTDSFRKKGKRSGGIYLDGTQHIQVRHSPLLDLAGDFTLTLWIHPEKLAEAVLIGKYGENDGYLLSLHSNGSFSFSFYGADAGLNTVQSESHCIQTGQWQQIGVSYESGENRIRLMRNGSVMKEKKQVFPEITKSPSDLYIGGSPAPPGCVTARVDEVCIFDHALPPPQFRNLYISGLPQVYTQNRETIDDSSLIWNHFHGNAPVPHPEEDQALMILRFNGSAHSVRGERPEHHPSLTFVPGEFGGAWNAERSGRGLKYRSPCRNNSGCFESWIILSENANELSPLVKMEGDPYSLELNISFHTAAIRIKNKQATVDSFSVTYTKIPPGRLLHMAFSWDADADRSTVRVFVNGVEAGRKQVPVKLAPGKTVWVGGNSGESFRGRIDDICFSSKAKTWGEVCPRGQMDSESSSLDLRQGFDTYGYGPLLHWFSPAGHWTYSVKSWDQPGEGTCIRQADTSGLKTLYHPDAYGFNSSMETVISLDSLHKGWTGIFVQSPGPSGNLFSGHTFMIHPATGQLRLATYQDGTMIRQKILENDFPFAERRLYTLTLSSVDGLLRGYIDNRNVISMLSETPARKGYAGLVTLDGTACFDDIHFTALTPPTPHSRNIEVRTVQQEKLISTGKLSLNAFRWKKRYGLLPWHRTYKNPEPPGNIFGPDERTLRPNPSAEWRSEDAANSSVVRANGTFYYLLRGNPDVNGVHGNAQIGTLWCIEREFDGIHFTDPELTPEGENSINILKGHADTNTGNCSDDPPRDKRFQLNDESGIYLNGKILMVCREFRNNNGRSRRFKRLVLGIYDTAKKSWISEEPILLDWSRMNPDSCFGRFRGINATPEITLLRDPESDAYVILLYHHTTGQNRGTGPALPATGSFDAVSGFRFDGITLRKHPGYETQAAIQKKDKVSIYGERVLFDNGIWYMNINAHTDGLRRDWPDRFELYSTLDPYHGPWQASSDNDRPYFHKGGEFDPDNGAIWQGEMLKYRNHYYMYYENYHVIDNPEVMYEYYNHPQSGSRVGYAVAN